MAGIIQKRAWIKLVLKKLWKEPCTIQTGDLFEVKKLVHEKAISRSEHPTSTGNLTSAFLHHKSVNKAEEFLDFIRPVGAHSVYLQFRYGTLPVAAFTIHWGIRSRGRTSVFMVKIHPKP